jgi:X-X-X-Leu-X-X-Gly heptad repeat protein
MSSSPIPCLLPSNFNFGGQAGRAKLRSTGEICRHVWLERPSPFRRTFLLLNQPVKPLRDAGGKVRHRFDRAIARDARQALPVLRWQRISILHGVSVPWIGLEGDDEIIPGLGRREERRRRPDPKAALDGEPRAARDGSQRLGDGAAQLKTGAAAERRAASGNHAARDGEPRAALGKNGFGKAKK